MFVIAYPSTPNNNQLGGLLLPFTVYDELNT